jgi:hypothetical protein
MTAAVCMPIGATLWVWRRDHRRQRQLDERIAQRYRQP